MILGKDDLKAIVDVISPLIDARAKTTETVLEAKIISEIKSSEKRIKRELRKEIRTSVEDAEDELQEEILAARAEAKMDSVTIHGKIDKILKNHEKRIFTLEETSGVSHKN